MTKKLWNGNKLNMTQFLHKKSLLKEKDLPILMPNMTINLNHTQSSLLGTKEIMLGIMLNMTQPTQRNTLLKLKSKPKGPTTPSLNKDNTIKTSKIFTRPWLNLKDKTNCHQLQKMKLLKNTTNSTHSKLLLTTTTDCLKMSRNMIIHGKPNLSFFLTWREITLGTLTSMTKPIGKNIRARVQSPMSKVLNSKAHIQRLKTQKKVLIQRMNLWSARTMLLRHSSMLNLQMRRDLPWNKALDALEEDAIWLLKPLSKLLLVQQLTRRN